MKRVIAICFLCIAVISCDNVNRKKKDDTDTKSSSYIYEDERDRQIENAKQNRELVPGKWRIIKVKATKDEAFESARKWNNKLSFDTYEFLPSAKYVFYKGKDTVEKGTIEWMAEDREIVMTPNNDSPVNRLLIRAINTKYMNANSRTLYMILKKVLPDTGATTHNKIAIPKRITHSS